MTAMSSHDLDNEGFYSFLTEELGENIEVYPLAGDASARKYFRIVREEESFVLMQWEAFKSLEDYPFTNVGLHLEKHGVRTPQIIASSPSEGLLLLEDLGDLTLERKFWESQKQETSLEFYKQAIDQLIRIHYPCTADRDENCKAFQIAFDTDKFLWELNYTRTNLLEGMCNIKFNSQTSAELEKLFLDIAKKLDEEDKFISHRDYHSRNLMIKLGKVRVIDYQDARLGPIQYDLVSLLKDSYVDLNQNMQEKLISYYLEQRSQFITKKIQKDQFDEIFELQSIQRCFKACGSFASFHQTRGDTRYLKYLSNTLQTVKKSLELFPEYKLLDQILTEHGVYDKDYDSL
jgi:aminoglycoside/choline kinase family phosphotransferase